MNESNKLLPRAVLRGCAVIACLLSVSAAHAVSVKITIENLNPEGGLWMSPFFLGFHDGSFDMFDPGNSASASIEAVAESGDSSGLASDISGVAGAKSALATGTSGPPGVIFAPGEMASIVVDLNATLNRYLSFASMVVPSNDAFLGNANPTAYDLFDIAGAFKHGFEINLFGADIWDSGTELNDGMGAAFSTLGGVSTDTLDPIGAHPGLDLFVGTELPIGENLLYAFNNDTPIARITAEQVPDSGAYLGTLGFLALIGFRFVAKRRIEKATR